MFSFRKMDPDHFRFIHGQHLENKSDGRLPAQKYELIDERKSLMQVKENRAMSPLE